MPTARFKTLILGTNLSGTDNGDDTITLESTATGGGGASLSDTLAWMPLVDADGTCVLDADDDLIPTLIPI